LTHSVRGKINLNNNNNNIFSRTNVFLPTKEIHLK